MIDVVAALIKKDDKFLICQRSSKKDNSLLWEFVGGKVEKNESKENALIRECFEELRITVKVGKLYAQQIYKYPDKIIRLSLFEAEIVQGVPKLLEHNDIKWITLSETAMYQFCPADKFFIEKMLRQ
ncbi:MAG: (deoxy)nucleoside triphosphate pyrophosphohydrolase [Erysipelotrichia bacterium]|nr:(deoxy)nucleoside triphosphate pyrophosphohydrolase [Erysipelotrichia bacterium]